MPKKQKDTRKDKKRKQPSRTKRQKLKRTKVSPTDKKRKRLERLEKRLKRVDKELALIERELRVSVDSTVLEEEFEERELIGMGISDRKNQRKFYRNFVFKCMKCLGKFEYDLQFGTMKKRAKCTACGKIHGVMVTPSSIYHHVDIPKSLKVLKKKK